jgi:ribosome biogenesis GTPase
MSRTPPTGRRGDDADRPQRERKPLRDGRVIVNFSRHALVEEDTGTRLDCQVRGRNLQAVCGDRVRFRAQGSGFGVVEEVLPRRSVLSRHDKAKALPPLAANVDRMFIVSAPVPTFQAFLVDKYLVAAHALGIEPVLVLNKCDLVAADDPLHELIAEYAALGIATLSLSAQRGTGADEFRQLLAGKTSIVVGESGTGKSSLVRLAVPDLELKVGELNRATGEGKHTTTRTMLFRVPSGGELIDSPGVRDFYLWPMAVRELAGHFIEFLPLARSCKFADCTHISEPACAVRAAVDADQVLLRRYEAYLGLARIMEKQFVGWEKKKP